jgi:DNA polymerase IV
MSHEPHSAIHTSRIIFHVDMDAFFVSVEELLDPSLKGKPVVVGGRPDQRGVVSAASYAVRKFGVHSAMPLRSAYKLCPQAIFLDGHPHMYREYSDKAFTVFQSVTPLVEMASIDEAYLDMTGTERLHGPPLAAAHKLHEKMKRDTGLNCSIGIGRSRLVAKVASDQAKPNGVFFVLPGFEARWLAPLDVRKIPGIGKVTEKRLHDLGVRKVGDLARLDEALLDQQFGEWGRAMAGKARGEDAGSWFDGEIGEEEAPKSISHEHTFDQDTTDREQIGATLARLAEMVGRRLREHGLFARTVQLKLRYKDFRTIMRARTLDHATQLDTEIHREVRALVDANWNGRPIRLLGVHASGLEAQPSQLSLLEPGMDDRWSKALSAADRVRDRFGESAVSLATGLKGNFRERVHENPAGLPGKRPKDIRRPTSDGG